LHFYTKLLQNKINIKPQKGFHGKILIQHWR